MSNGFDLHCLDCKAYAGFDWNWGGDSLRPVLERRKEFEGVAVLLDTLDWRFTDVGVDGSALIKAARFVGAHGGHRVVVMDEYGAIWERCSKRVEFGCGHTHYCRRKPEHVGACSLDEDKS